MAAAHEARRLVPDRVHKFTRQEIVDLVREAWMGLPHDEIARVGYVQTGPTLPMDGSNDAGVFRDLLPWWSRVDGPELRRQCQIQVQGMWDAGIVRSWRDADSVIETHAPHNEILEGLEHCPYDIEDDGEVGGLVPEGTGAESAAVAVEETGKGGEQAAGVVADEQVCGRKACSHDKRTYVRMHRCVFARVHTNGRTHMRHGGAQR